MSNDLITDAMKAVTRFVFVLVVNWGVRKSIALACCVLLCAVILTIQPAETQEKDMSKASASPDEFISMLKTHIILSEDQETRIRPIIEESFQKRHEIERNDSQDRKTMRSRLQELRWSTDLQIGKILTDEQMKEYRNLREEQNGMSENNDLQHGRKFRFGGLSGS